MSKNEPPIMAHDPLADLDDLAEEAVAETPLVSATTVSNEVFTFGDTLTIADVGELMVKVQAQLDSLTGGLKLDVGQIEMVDGAGMQLLTVFVKEVTQRQAELEWVDIPDCIKETANDTGMTQALLLTDR